MSLSLSPGFPKLTHVAPSARLVAYFVGAGCARLNLAIRAPREDGLE